MSEPTGNVIDLNTNNTEQSVISTNDTIDTSKIESSATIENGQETKQVITSTRNNFQLSRRAFHFLTGTSLAIGYNYLLSHDQAVFIIGTCACIIYLSEQIRLKYPEFSGHLEGLTKYLLRAEEKLKESAALPYAIAVLLVIISFPKLIAISALLTLAIADPLAALVGIKFGKHNINVGKTAEGSAAFFIASIFCVAIPFTSNGLIGWKIWCLAVVTAICTTAFETVPLRLDDNLTIPLFTAFTVWIFTIILNIPVF